MTQVWEELTSPENGITIFTAVPTIYAKLLEYYNSGIDLSLTEKRIKHACEKIRYVVGSSR